MTIFRPGLMLAHSYVSPGKGPDQVFVIIPVFRKELVAPDNDARRYAELIRPTDNFGLGANPADGIVIF